MATLDLTLSYTPLLALIVADLSLLVVIQRRRSDVPYRDGDIVPLRGAIRAHGNFAEYVPISLILIGLLEFTGATAWLIHGLFVLLILARLSHAKAMFSVAKSPIYFVSRVFPPG
ncbi:MAG: MAPEG family protein [Pseudohongiellaceae bacterium]